MGSVSEEALVRCSGWGLCCWAAWEGRVILVVEGLGWAFGGSFWRGSLRRDWVEVVVVVLVRFEREMAWDREPWGLC